MPGTNRATDLLDRTVADLNRRLPQPTLRDDWFQYAKSAQDARTVVITRLVRIVSGRRTVKLLVECGHLQEMGVLLRSIYSSLGEAKG